MKTTLAVVIVAAGFLLAARPTVAHHAFSAEFDANMPVNLTGFAGFSGWSLTFLPNNQGVTKDLLEMHISGNYRYTKTNKARARIHAEV